MLHKKLVSNDISMNIYVYKWSQYRYYLSREYKTIQKLTSLRAITIKLF